LHAVAEEAPDFTAALVRRALDLARDGQITADDAGDHLCRLASGQRPELETAEQTLLEEPDRDSTAEHALLLLHHAVELLPDGQ
jgi:hypothetical protein